MQHSLEFLRFAVSYGAVRLCVERRDRGHAAGGLGRKPVQSRWCVSGATMISFSE